MSDKPIQKNTAADSQAVCAALQQAGVSQAQINLALETSGALLEQLAAYPLDEQHKKSVLQIFQTYAPAGD